MRTRGEEGGKQRLFAQDDRREAEKKGPTHAKGKKRGSLGQFPTEDHAGRGRTHAGSKKKKRGKKCEEQRGPRDDAQKKKKREENLATRLPWGQDSRAPKEQVFFSKSEVWGGGVRGPTGGAPPKTGK